MYPNGSVTRGGGTPAPDWRAKLPDALKTKVPDGADGFIKDGDVIIFTKGGEAVDGGKFNPDGSKYNPATSENANPEVRTPSGTTPVGDGRGGAGRAGAGNGNGGSSSLFNYGFSSGNTGDLTANFVNGSYNIDPNKFMGAAMGFNAMSSLAQMMPFGLGAVFANNSVGTALNGFMKSVSFNFDFSRFSTSASTGDDTVSGGREDDSEGAVAPTGGGDKSVAELAKSRGYAPTDTDGVYKNNGKFYKYDDKSKEFVECKADGTALGSSEQPASSEQPVLSGQTTSGQSTTGTEQSTPVDNTAPKKKPAQTSGNEYNVSRHSDKVFWKKSGGTTKYYIDQNGKKVEISGYDGKTYTLNGKTYDAKTGQEIKADKTTTTDKTTMQKPATQRAKAYTGGLNIAHPQLNGNFRENGFLNSLKNLNREYEIETTSSGNVYKYKNADGKKMEVRFDKEGKPTKITTYSSSFGSVYDISYHANGQRKHMTHGAIESTSNVVWEDWSYDQNGTTTDYVKGVRVRNKSWKDGQVYRESHSWKGGEQTVRKIPAQVLNGGSGVTFKEGDHLTWTRSGNNFVRKDSASGETWTFDKNGKLIKRQMNNGDVKTYNANGWNYIRKGY